jgi:hypothetical protein
LAPEHHGTVRQQIVRLRRQRLELILIDSRLVNKVGHHYMLAKTVSGALARRKLLYRIFGLSGLEPSIAAEIGVIPHFSRSAYECVEFSWSEKRMRSKTNGETPDMLIQSPSRESTTRHSSQGGELGERIDPV